MEKKSIMEVIKSKKGLIITGSLVILGAIGSLIVGKNMLEKNRNVIIVPDIGNKAPEDATNEDVENEEN